MSQGAEEGPKLLAIVVQLSPKSCERIKSTLDIVKIVSGLDGSCVIGIPKVEKFAPFKETIQDCQEWR